MQEMGEEGEVVASAIPVWEWVREVVDYHSGIGMGAGDGGSGRFSNTGMGVGAGNGVRG